MSLRDAVLNGAKQAATRVPNPNLQSGANAFASVQNFLGNNLGSVGDAIGGAVKATALDFVADSGFGKALRATNLLGGILGGAEDVSAMWGSNNDLDWRVRLSVPSNMQGGPILRPLSETNGMVFPYTPQVMIQSSAGYSEITPVHNNYPYLAYQNSRVNAMTITGEFVCENAKEGEYWIAAVHYLRSITKMSYGNSSNKGAPPPVVHLNGYGDYVFKNVPVVVTEFVVDLLPSTDYIQVDTLGPNGSWVPVKSSISVTAQPVYSRTSQARFSLDSFVRGDYIVSGKGFI